MRNDEVEIEDYQGTADPSVLIPYIGCSYSEIKELEAIVVLLNQWHYKQAIDQLNNHIADNKQLIDSLLLKGEVLALFEYNEQALDIFQTVYQKDSENIYAIGMILIQLHILKESKEEIDYFFSVLKNKSLKVHDEIKSIMKFIEDHRNMRPLKMKDNKLDLICVYGYVLNTDGSIPVKLRKRLLKTFEIAEKYPNTKILLSGGAVKNGYSEAEEMQRYLMNSGLKKDRMICLKKAKDTVGNVMEFMDYIKMGTYNNICAITSADHLPRAWMALHCILKKNQYNTNLYSEAYEESVDLESIKYEKILNYHTIFRAAGLFTKKEFNHYLS